MTDLLGLGVTALAVCIAATVAGGLVKGVTGMGLPLVALPIMASFIPLPKAIALLTVPSIATSVWQSLHGGQFMTSAKRLWLLLAGILIGVAVSVRMLATFDLQVLYAILGVIVTAFATLLRRRIVFTVTPRAERWAAPLTGVIAGLIGGVSMLFGPIYAMYLSGLNAGKDFFVAAISLANVCAALSLTVAMAGHGLLGGADFLASTLALVPVWAGLLLGQRLRRHIDEDAFRKVLAVMLFLIGLNLIRRAVMPS